MLIGAALRASMCRGRNLRRKRMPGGQKAAEEEAEKQAEVEAPGDPGAGNAASRNGVSLFSLLIPMPVVLVSLVPIASSTVRIL